jgi:hypothetical protein
MTVSRGLALAFASLLLPGLAGAQAPARGLVEMDVLAADEAPAGAMERMDRAHRQAAARGEMGDPPEPRPYLPEESLGARGLALPAALEPLAEMPGHAPPGLPDFGDLADHAKDHDKDHDKDGGGDDDDGHWGG